MTEHTTVRPASRCATEVAGNCPCPTCSGGRPYVAVHADSQFDTARLSVMGVQAGVTLRLSADELMCLAALCTEAAVELRRSQPTRAAHWVN